ncbi:MULTISPECIES: phosphotransferase [Brevibacillus]|jgi:Predicted aminoglycoside phosphotransferase|uniref:phosphotransferase n=1 Tax=Brevibacillus TaxID=55080 RepID=UPI000EEC7DE0|nr:MULTISPECIES: phosphotransferase [Brevibacillus]MBU8715487.1 phosphotransferase [Brevibacillus parabrevis]MED2254421.1 phosphotransferase [Brevibacillus parabrevis]NRQ54567.1 phosphotransferase [Brevibacillus sp. HD1.4A]UED67357.1 phosphotransferase [Brevibacillus sp. HD3.3A]WDV93617.1 phosphotransferase [Brevibacillus parabrevis]
MTQANPWKAEWDVTQELAQALIYSQFPALSSMRVKRLGDGWDNTVYLVGAKYVFRFPRRKLAVELIGREGRLLPKLAPYVTLPYAKPLFYGEGTPEYPVPFLGYVYVQGEFPVGLTDEQRASSGPLLARFLKRLHAFPVAIAKENGVLADHRALLDVAARKAKMVQLLADPHLPFEESDRSLLMDYLHDLNAERLQPKEVFMHGDLHFKNMLVTPNGQIAGIIDWGDMCIGHPGCDLNIAYSFLPPEARDDFFREYGEVDEETKLLARLMAVYIPMLIYRQAKDTGDTRVAQEARDIIKRALAESC